METIEKEALSTADRACALKEETGLGSVNPFSGIHMSPLLLKTWSRKALLLGSLMLGLTQVGCAHPIFMEPSVVVHSRLGHFPIQAQIGGPGQVLVAPPPRVIYLPPPPQVIYVPQIYRQAPGWHHGHNGRPDRSDGGRRGRGDDRRSHGGHDGWRR